MQVALREARVWGARAQLLPQALRRLHREELEQALLHAASVDRLIKGLGQGDVWEELLRLGLRIAAPSSGGRRRATPTASGPRQSTVRGQSTVTGQSR
jgi:hypothetical protein